jgi:uncharacterized membrane protein (DUF2068 family)
MATERQSMLIALAFSLGGIAAAVIGVHVVVPVTHDSVGRDAAFFLALPLLGAAAAALLRSGRWVRFVAALAGSVVASFAGIDLWADPGVVALVLLLASLTVVLVAVCWPARVLQER